MTEKHAGGRPRKFKTVAEMEEAIEAYFFECDDRTVPFVTKEGIVLQIPSPAPYTVMGLANLLGLSRQGLLNYEHDDEFVDTIKKAKGRVHQNLEFRMLDGRGYGPGHIFGLKNNYDWKDKHDVKHEGGISIVYADKDLEDI